MYFVHAPWWGSQQIYVVGLTLRLRNGVVTKVTFIKDVWELNSNWKLLLHSQEAKAMLKNVGPFDRILRVIGSLIVGALILTGYISGTWSVVWGVAAAIILLTGFVGVCPIYLMLRIRTLALKK